LTRELLDTLQMMVQHFTKTPSTLADSKARGKAHEVIAKAYEQIGYAAPAQSCGDAEQADEAVKELQNIVNAKRFDHETFADDTEFADWVQSRARHTLARAKDSK
jgi:muramoyltetrapeptide carboxypeptidase LdcA involved in peptidoglycan recycling